jgi:ATP-dependent DNA helicase DinG
VLCTSHDAVRELSDRVERALGGRHAILRQGRSGKGRILDHFRKDRGAVLFGTDSFWEGVSVRGDGLRLVAIPRLPFRVPTDPVAEARYERLRDRGQDPFRAWSLPEAVLRLRQGFGRLIRSGTDRGAVLVLDRRLHEQWYGKVFLQSLPAARRVVGPSRVVMERLRAFYAGWAAPVSRDDSVSAG